MPASVGACMGGRTPRRRSSSLGFVLLGLVFAGAIAVADNASAARAPTAVALVTRDAIVTSGRDFELELRCPGSARTCEGRVTLRELRPVAKPSATARKAAKRKRRKLRLARGEVSLRGGVSTTVGLRLSKKAFKRVRRRGPLVARVVMSGRDATGRRVRLKRKVRIGVPARERPSLLLGVADDRIEDAPAPTGDLIRGLGLGAVRIVVLWEQGQSMLSASQAAMLAGVVSSAPDMRIVLASRSRSGAAAPRTDAERAAYCSFLADAAVRFPAIRDFGVWLEPNKQHFWAPQYSADGESVAPAHYVALLAHCWDVLHSARADVNVIGPSTSSKGNDRPAARSNVSHSPAAFIRAMGAAYRASGRTAPLLDTVGHHAYGEHAAERPWFRHRRSSTLGLGDWYGLMQALHDAFSATPQPVPGEGDVAIWYLESGFQTTPSATPAARYTGVETEKHPLPELVADGDLDPATPRAPDHATQLRDAIELAYCQPHVGALFNFLLYDEQQLGRWQSGLFGVDGTPKASITAYRQAVAAASARKISCSKLKGGPVKRAFVPKRGVGVTRIGWARATRFNHKHDLWRVHVQLDEPSSYVASIVPVRLRGTSARPLGEPIRSITGTLRRGFYQWVTFPRKRLAPGLYRIELTATSSENPARTASLDGPVFEVLPRRPRL